MPSKRILVIAESINIDDSSGSKANVALIRSLNHAGCELFILHYTRIDIQLDGLECRSIPENRSSLIFFLVGFNERFNIGLAGTWQNNSNRNLALVLLFSMMLKALKEN